MKSFNIATFGSAALLVLGLALPVFAATEMTTGAEVAQFQGAKMNLADAVGAAEKLTGGVAMEASWESAEAGGSYQIVIVKADATRMLATVAADGTVATKALKDDQDEQADTGDGDGETQD